MAAMLRMRYAEMAQTTSSKTMVQKLTDQDLSKPKRTQSKPDFDTLKLTVTNLEEKRMRGDREKTKLLKAARIKQNESE
ncbi:hypothetical protein RU07_23675 [Agrobacterium tumefaciens]|uniref:Uncharacterized protein n=1 Tax=Agrobacterium tumefaciens TaxID=358 RepID=A0A0D0IWN5_AGRTU|nr:MULTISPECIES: hypothetical protein [unclassified Rhizobium]KIP97617.1 hypothetical protein RU07_23675 [Agrobacterium tumefaciens]